MTCPGSHSQIMTQLQLCPMSPTQTLSPPLGYWPCRCGPHSPSHHSLSSLQGPFACYSFHKAIPSPSSRINFICCFLFY